MDYFLLRGIISECDLMRSKRSDKVKKQEDTYATLGFPWPDPVPSTTLLSNGFPGAPFLLPAPWGFGG